MNICHFIAYPLWRLGKSNTESWRSFVLQKYDRSFMMDCYLSIIICLLFGKTLFLFVFSYSLVAGIALKESICFAAGNGVWVHFWSDIWVENQSLRNLFPRLFIVILARRMAGLLMWVIWNLPWRREFRTDEADLYDHLINIPSQVHLFPTSEERLEWIHESRGLFFVKYSRK